MYVQPQSAEDAALIATLVFMLAAGLVAHRLSMWQLAILWASSVASSTIVAIIEMRNDLALDLDVLGSVVSFASIGTDVSIAVTLWIARSTRTERGPRVFRQVLVAWIGFFTYKLVRNLLGYGFGCATGGRPYADQSFTESLQHSFPLSLFFAFLVLAPPVFAAALAPSRTRQRVARTG